MQDLITRMDGWLQQHRPAYYATLATGVSFGALDEYERRTGITLPADLRTLWVWKNGSTEEALFDNHMFISVEDSLSSKLELDGMIGSDFEDPEWWKLQWVPFTQSFGGDHLCIDIASEKTGGIIDFWHDDPRREVVAPTLKDWLHSLVETMESGRLELA
jgi:cell wall assembly regulator SMI1